MLTVIEKENKLVVDSRLVAEELGIKHKAFLETIRKHKETIESAFGHLTFETATVKNSVGAVNQATVCYLTEDQATFVMTLSRNTEQVVQCKVNLVKAFSEAKKRVEDEESNKSFRGAYWYERSKLAFSSLNHPLPCGYFSAYEYIIKLFQEMELYLGYVMPDFNPATNRYIIPDISIGKRFNYWLRKDDDYAVWCREYYLGSSDPIDFRKPDYKTGRTEGKNYNEIVQYEHVYPTKSHGECTAWMVNAYPNRYKALFETFFSVVWLPIQFPRYLKERDHAFLDEVKQRYNQLPDHQKESLSATHVGKLIPALPSN